jgi:hypothetical protein
MNNKFVKGTTRFFLFGSIFFLLLLPQLFAGREKKCEEKPLN